MKKRNAFPETMKVAVLSTGHMTLSDSRLLAKFASVRVSPSASVGIIVDATPYGWYVHISSDEKASDIAERLNELGFSRGFQFVIATAKVNKFQKVNFDQDGPESDAFQKYEW